MTKTNENMSEFTILKDDNWVKIADSGDVITMQNINNIDCILQVVDAEPDIKINWGFRLNKMADKPFVCSHNVYARAIEFTTIIVVQKD